MANFLDPFINQNTINDRVNDSCSLNRIIWNHFLGNMNLSACHAVSKLVIESRVNGTGHTNIYIFIDI